MNINIFGIRHHGPGSARSLLLALEEMQPDIILIEGPPDCDKLVSYIANENLEPPVALLVYNPKEFGQAAYFPFTHFSPEWQAMKYAVKAGIEVRFMDLPQSLQFSIKKAEEQNQQLEIEDGEEDVPTEIEQQLSKDPLAYMAELAGYKDSERWWEVTFEQVGSQAEIFPAILELMTALRLEMGREETRMTLLREAFMRKTMRQAKKDGFQNIAVVCGAWHSPVLDLDKFKVGQDNKVLRGIKKINTKSTWVPWSYARIATSSGYGAGVNSPAWYGFLFDSREGVVIRWMAEVARLFRVKDMGASSAHIIEAVRLAEALALLRGLPLPGIDELYQAATTIFCQGDPIPMRLIEKELIVGTQVGEIPEEIPVIPLQQDLEKTIKSARLKAYWGKEGTETRDLDLRKSTQLMASHLLHRLNILNIPWGTKLQAGGNLKGSFHEYWRLDWDVSLSLAVIEAGMWGNTVYKAAVNYSLKKGKEILELPKLTALIKQVLDAELVHAIPILIKKLQESAALTKDVGNMMEALHPLVQVLRYGDTRKTEVGSVGDVVDSLIPRICISLPAACMDINDEAADTLFTQITETNRAINILKKQEHNEMWNKAIFQISQLANANSIIKGASSRILFDKSVVSLPDTARAMQYALSKGNDSNVSAAWLEGFLHGSGLLLLYNKDLWRILDEWVSLLFPQNFEEILPLLRRTFSEYAPTEREKMMKLALGKSTGIAATTEEDIDMERAEQVLPVLQLIMNN